MNVKCPRCGNNVPVGLDYTRAVEVELDLKAERNVRIVQEESKAAVQMKRLKLQRDVAKEARRTCAELAKSRKDVQREIARNQEAAQQGISIGPGLTAVLQSLVDRLIEAEGSSSALT